MLNNLEFLQPRRFGVTAVSQQNTFYGIVINADMENSWDIAIRELLLDLCSNPFY
jgi:hypothetical protein